MADDEAPLSYTILWRDPSEDQVDALTFAVADDDRVWILRGFRGQHYARYLPRPAVIDIAHKLSQWVEATANCPECDHPRTAHYQSSDWGSGCLLAVDSDAGVHRCECKGLDGRGPRILVSL